MAKQTKLPFPISETKSNACFDLVHMDIWGPISITSMHGFRYFLTVVDDYYRYVWIFLMKSKHETRNIIDEFITMVQNQFEKTIKCIRS